MIFPLLRFRLGSRSQRFRGREGISPPKIRRDPFLACSFAFFCRWKMKHITLRVRTCRYIYIYSIYHARSGEGFKQNPATRNSNVAQYKLARMVCLGSDERVPCVSDKPFYPPRVDSTIRKMKHNVTCTYMYRIASNFWQVKIIIPAVFDTAINYSREECHLNQWYLPPS